MADMGGLQLLPETRKKIEVSVPGQNKPAVLALIVIALVLAFYFGLATYNQGLTSSIAAIDNQLADLERSRDKNAETAIIDLRRQLAVVNPLITAHLFWSEAFTQIQSIAQPQVQFQAINADVPGKKVVLKMLAANYTIVARQIAALYTLPSVTDVILNKVQSQPNNKLDVTMQINFDTAKFLKKINLK